MTIEVVAFKIATTAPKAGEFVVYLRAPSRFMAPIGCNNGFSENAGQAGEIVPSRSTIHGAAGEGLTPSSQGVRARFSGKDRIVTDSPFAETKELAAGSSIWEVNSMEEAIARVKRCRLPDDSEVEIRPLFTYTAEEVSEIVSQPK